MKEYAVTPLLYKEIDFISKLNIQKHRTLPKKNTIIFFSDKDIVAGMKVHNIMVIKYLYTKFYSEIKSMVIANSGSGSDAEDLFQDALLLLYQKISNEGLQLLSSFNTYLYSICRHLWLQKLKKRGMNDEHKEYENFNDFKYDWDPDELMQDSEKYNMFQRHFLRLNLNEQKVLRLYLNKTPSIEAAKIMGYKSVNYAKARKYNCKEKLKNSIINDPAFKNIYQTS